ncbi:MAG TPA: hypothetical protein VNX28_13305, partial [Gemmataceae bacterium]|nr:hypothetical protein [Gemmataceae bacterium]
MLLSTFTVVNTSDSGPGSLRQAILDANTAATGTTANPDLIQFAMPANDPNHFYYQDDSVSGQVSRANVAVTTATDDSQIANIDPDWNHSWWSIQVTSVLPEVDDGVVIDGYTQVGATSNTLGIGPGSPGHELGDGDNAVLRIELNGMNAGAGANGLTLNNHDSGLISTVRGLVVNNFDIAGISLGTGETAVGNFVGTDVSGTIALGNGAGSSSPVGDVPAGILAQGKFITVGGLNPADRNLISG